MHIYHVNIICICTRFCPNNKKIRNYQLLTSVHSGTRQVPFLVALFTTVYLHLLSVWLWTQNEANQKKKLKLVYPNTPKSLACSWATCPIRSCACSPTSWSGYASAATSHRCGGSRCAACCPTPSTTWRTRARPRRRRAPRRSRGSCRTSRSTSPSSRWVWGWLGCPVRGVGLSNWWSCCKELLATSYVFNTFEYKLLGRYRGDELIVGKR